MSNVIQLGAPQNALPEVPGKLAVAVLVATITTEANGLETTPASLKGDRPIGIDKIIVALAVLAHAGLVTKNAKGPGYKPTFRGAAWVISMQQDFIDRTGPQAPPPADLVTH